MSADKRSILVVLLLATTACSPPDRDPERRAWSERDSAGVMLVENRMDEIPGDLWSVSPEPEVSIGGVDAPEPQQIFRVRGATRLPDGRLAVASAGTHDVRVYSPRGELLARFGAEGDGPEEFRSPALLGRHGADTLVVFDADLARISRIHPDLGFLGSSPVSWEGNGFAVGRGLMDDGSILVGGGMSFSSSGGFTTGVIRPLSSYGWLGRGGDGSFVLGDFPAAGMFAQANEQGMMARSLPFSPTTSATRGPGGAWLGTAEEPVIRLFGMDGRIRRVVTLTGALRPITDADERAWADAEIAEASTPNEARQIRSLMEEMPFPSRYPSYRALATDAAGNLWVEAYPAPGVETPEWTVLDPQGHAVTRVTTPPRTRVLEIGEGYLLGVTRDEMEVEALTLWSLTRR